MGRRTSGILISDMDYYNGARRRTAGCRARSPDANSRRITSSVCPDFRQGHPSKMPRSAARCEDQRRRARTRQLTWIGEPGLGQPTGDLIERIRVSRTRYLPACSPRGSARSTGLGDPRPPGTLRWRSCRPAPARRGCVAATRGSARPLRCEGYGPVLPPDASCRNPLVADRPPTMVNRSQEVRRASMRLDFCSSPIRGNRDATCSCRVARKFH